MFVYCGGKSTALKDGERATYEMVIMEQFVEHFEDVEVDNDVGKDTINLSLNQEGKIVNENSNEHGEVKAL